MAEGAEDKDDNHPDNRPEFELRPRQWAANLVAGARVELLDGSLCVVVENPLDGIWLYIMRDGAAEDEGVMLGAVKRVVESTT